MTRVWVLAAFSTALVGCTAHGMGSAGMETDLAEVDEELGRHHGAVMDAASLPGVVAEAFAHESNMSRIMEGMDDSMGGMMSHCSGAGMSEMHEIMTDMQSEMHSHAGTLESSADLGSAQTRCESHVAEMREMVSTMRGALGRTGCGTMRW